MDLLQYNTWIENKEIQQIPPHFNLLHEWIWNSDPQEDLQRSSLLNTNQLLGLLYCRKAVISNAHKMTNITIQGNIRLSDSDPFSMTLQQLIDTVDNICIEWPVYIHTHTSPQTPQIKNVFGFVDQCLIRFGQLVSHAYPATILNNSLLTQEHSPNLVSLTLPCIRRLLNGFLILYRHFYLFSQAITVPDAPCECVIRKPHIEASMEFFDTMCMHYLIPVGARLRYKNEFRGMYNHISQVMYFHNQHYERIPRQNLDMIKLYGDPLHTLPALTELYPEIPILYEEDHFMHQKNLKKWFWLIVAGRIYLLSPEKQIYYANNIIVLLQLWIDKNPKQPKKNKT